MSQTDQENLEQIKPVPAKLIGFWTAIGVAVGVGVALQSIVVGISVAVGIALFTAIISAAKKRESPKPPGPAT